MARQTSNHAVRVRQTTRLKLEAIAASRLWSLVDCVDVLANEFMTRHGIQMPKRTDSGQRVVSPNSPITPTIRGLSKARRQTRVQAKAA